MYERGDLEPVAMERAVRSGAGDGAVRGGRIACAAMPLLAKLAEARANGRPADAATLNTALGQFDREIATIAPQVREPAVVLLAAYAGLADPAVQAHAQQVQGALAAGMPGLADLTVLAQICGNAALPTTPSDRGVHVIGERSPADDVPAVAAPAGKGRGIWLATCGIALLVVASQGALWMYASAARESAQAALTAAGLGTLP